MPTLMWHKSSGATIGETFYIDPPGYPNLCNPKYIKSTKNVDMNDPGIRYYQLWDTNPDSNGNLNRVGKVFPDSQLWLLMMRKLLLRCLIKQIGNWTIPAPKLSLLTPNTCFSNGQNATGILSNDTERMWVTYRLDSTGFTNSLHCNYYSVITGPGHQDLWTTDSQNVAVRFGNEFPFLSDGSFARF